MLIHAATTMICDQRWLNLRLVWKIIIV